MANPFENVPVSRNYRMLELEYVRCLKRLIKRIRNGKSIRSQARQIRLSHTRLQQLIKVPETTVSPKTMRKIIRAVRRPKKKRIMAGPVFGGWVPDAL